ncbi:MAG: hypothetical protein PHX72_02995 [Candidatus Shapirobacteria bacterium]|nr:hypothetical protein [Candidatus Shapirobacteria bacterium]
MPSRKLIIILLILFFFFTPPVVQSQIQPDQHIWKRTTQTQPQKIADYLKIEETKISAVVGYGQITIEGYTSPEASVRLNSSQDNLGQYQTRANKEGFFKFNNVILPYQPGELWLQAIDRQGLAGAPVAIPQPPPGLEKIEDIILPPTLAHNNGIFKKGVRGLAFGYAIPNSQIEIYFFESPINSWLKKLFAASPLPPRKAQAQQKALNYSNTNKLILETDKKGYFSFELPNQKAQSFRYYAGNVFRENYSPKSNILSFRVLSLIEAFYQQILILADKFLALILPFLQDLLFWIFLEIVVLAILIKNNSKRTTIN